MRKKLVQILLSILTLFSLLQPASVFADTGWTSTSTKTATVYRNGYIYTCYGEYTRENPATNAGAGSVPTLLFTINNQTVFCLEPQMYWYSISVYDKLATGAAADAILQQNVSTLNYTSAQIQKLAQICSVGYGYNGDTSAAMHAATQVALWQVKADIFSQIPSDVQEDLELIQSRLKVFSVSPSFAGQTVSFKGIGKSNAVSITDTSGVFQHYIEGTIPSGVHITQNGNALELWLDETADLSGSMSFYGLYDPSEASNLKYVYSSDDSQILGTFTKVTTPVMTLNYEIDDTTQTDTVKSVKTENVKASADFELIKTDGVTTMPVQGAEFDLYVDDQKVGTVITDENGKASYTFDSALEVTSDTYTETYVTNWNSLAQTFQEAALEKGYFASKEEAQQAADAKASADLQKKKDAFLSGEHEFKVVETASAKGYYIDPDETEQIVTDTFNQTLEFAFVNYPQSGTIEIEKTGETLTDFWQEENDDGLLKTNFVYTQQPLLNAQFTITAAETIEANGSVVYSKGDTAAVITTDENGKAKAGNLPLGTYLIQETSAPSGYYLDKEGIEVTISASDSSQTVSLQKLKRENLRQKLVIDVTKTDNKNQPLQNAVFGLYAAQDITVNGKTLQAGDLIEECVSDSEGKVNFEADLPLSLYEIRELQAPEGYTISNKTLSVNGQYTNAGQKENVIHIPCVNTFTMREVTILKCNDDKDAITTSPAVFGIYSDAECTNLLYELKTSQETGKVQIPLSEPGLIYVQELQAPDGYRTSDEIIQIEVKNNGKILVNDKEWDDQEIYCYSNQFNPRAVTIEKVNVDGEIVGSQAVFGLYTDEECTDLARKAGTDEEGRVEFAFHTPGIWYIRELEAPQGYVLDETIRTIEVKEDGTLLFDDEEIENAALLQWENTYETHTFTILKCDSSEMAIVSRSAIFGVYEDEQCTALLEEIESDSQTGLVSISFSAPGIWWIQEISAPAGCALSDEVIQVEILENGQMLVNETEWSEEEAYLYVNEFEVQKLLLKKCTAQNTAITQNAALFGIYEDEELNNLLLQFQTDENNGCAAIPFQAPGVWYIAEIEAPQGYQLSDEVLKVQVLEDGRIFLNDEEVQDEEAEYAYVNEEKPAEPAAVVTPNNTGGASIITTAANLLKTPLFFVLAAALLAAAALIFKLWKLKA